MALRFPVNGRRETDGQTIGSLNTAFYKEDRVDH